MTLPSQQAITLPLADESATIRLGGAIAHLLPRPCRSAAAHTCIVCSTHDSSGVSTATSCCIPLMAALAGCLLACSGVRLALVGKARPEQQSATRPGAERRRERCSWRDEQLARHAGANDAFMPLCSCRRPHLTPAWLSQETIGGLRSWRKVRPLWRSMALVLARRHGAPDRAC